MEEFEDVATCWTKQYERSKSECIHVQFGFHCKLKERCRAGCRLRRQHILVGNIVKLWGRLSKWLHSNCLMGEEDDDDKGHQNTKRALRLIRATVDKGPPLVGAEIPASKVELIRRNLKVRNSEHCYDRSKCSLFRTLQQLLALLIVLVHAKLC